MSDISIAKSLLLGKNMFKIERNEESIKFFIRYNKENKYECKKFLQQINEYITQIYKGKRLWYYFENPYEDSIMLYEIRGKHIDAIYGRWEYFEKFIGLKKG